jgi:hypothetical protein
MPGLMLSFLRVNHTQITPGYNLSCNYILVLAVEDVIHYITLHYMLHSTRSNSVNPV